MFNNKRKFRILFCSAAIASAIAASACTPVTATRGNFIESYQIEEIVPGEHTRSEVGKILGSPTVVAPFDDNTWYYLGQHTSKKGIFDPKVTDEHIIIVRFADNGTVQSIEENNEERINIPINENTTPTHGNDITIMQQLLGNLGKFNPDTRNPAM